MKYGKCSKCKNKSWLEKHHIYPQSQFNDEKNVIYICSNCHTDLHQKLGKPDKDKSFYSSFHLSWIWGVISLLIILGLISIFI